MNEVLQRRERCLRTTRVHIAQIPASSWYQVLTFVLSNATATGKPLMCVESAEDGVLDKSTRFPPIIPGQDHATTMQMQASKFGSF